MLRKLHIKNFKGWKDTGCIRMSPITLFFGTNSSGKSSIGQFLMMLKQTVEHPDRGAVLYPGGKYAAVQLGSYKEMIFQRDPRKNISFEYCWDLPEAMIVEDSASGKEYSGGDLAFEAMIGIDNKDKRAPVLRNFQYELLKKGALQLAVGMRTKKGVGFGSSYDISTKEYELKRSQGRPPRDLQAPVKFYGFPDEVVAYHQNADFVHDLNLQHEKLFNSLYYLGPLRTKTERLYPWTGIEPESVGYTGENTISAILAAHGRKIGINRRHAKDFQVIIADKLKEMGLIESFQLKPIARQRQEYIVQVKTRGATNFVDLPDVGFGITQVLPVLVQCFYAPAGSIILMEQPEIHLHPSAQSILADVMIEVINSREDGRNRNIQLIIETHSEHFLRRLQRRIAEDKIPQESISAYFANVSEVDTRLDPLQINKFGGIVNWPENFFGDEMEDITEQSKAALKKRMLDNIEDPEVLK